MLSSIAIHLQMHIHTTLTTINKVLLDWHGVLQMKIFVVRFTQLDGPSMYSQTLDHLLLLIIYITHCSHLVPSVYRVRRANAICTKAGHACFQNCFGFHLDQTCCTQCQNTLKTSILQTKDSAIRWVWMLKQTKIRLIELLILAR